MQDTGLAGQQAGDMGIGGDTKQFVEGWLTRAVVADRYFTNPDDAIDVYDVATYAASEGYRGHMVAASVTVGVQTLFAKCPCLGE